MMLKVSSTTNLFWKGTINKEMYVEILHYLRDAVRRKRPEKGLKKSCFSAWQCTCTLVGGVQEVP
jgi:hypothetical protein